MDPVKLKTKPEAYILQYEDYHKHRGLVRIHGLTIAMPKGNQFITNIPQKYKPKHKNKNLQKLKPIRIDDMTLENIHTGSYLKLKMISDCYQINDIILLCEDQTEKRCVVVGVCNFNCLGKNYDHYFKSGTVIYVKEPFYTKELSGVLTIKIDDQSDILFPSHPQVLALLKINKKEINIKGSQRQIAFLEQIRKKGMELMKAKLFYHAYFHYSNAIQKTKDKEFLTKFIMNKAIVCSKINFLKEYGITLDRLLTMDPNHKKGIYHKAKFFVLTKQYEKAKSLLRTKENYIEQQTEQFLQKLIRLKVDSEKGRFDWYAAITQDEIEEYQSENIEIREKGVFAKKKIKAGQILIVEKTAWFDGIYQQEGKLYFQFQLFFMALYQYSKEFKRKVDEIIFKYSIKKGTKVAEYQNDQTIQQKWQIILQYSCSIGPRKGDTERNIYIPKIGFINFSCEQNCQTNFIGSEHLVCFAVKQVEKDQELLIAKTIEFDYQKRKEKILQFTGSKNCGCLMCLQQEYEMLSGKPKINGKSMTLKKEKITDRVKNGLERAECLQQFYGIGSILNVVQYGKNLDLAAKMFRRIFPMKVEESIKIMQSYTGFYRNTERQKQ